MESLSNKITELRACSVIKKRLQHRFFLVGILKNLSEHLIRRSYANGCFCFLKYFYKEFVDISYENASLGILEDSIWLQLNYNCIWVYKISYSNALCSSIYGSNQSLREILHICVYMCVYEYVYICMYI